MSTLRGGSMRDELESSGRGLARERPALQDLTDMRQGQQADPVEALEQLRDLVEVLRRRQDAFEPRVQQLAVEVAAANVELAASSRFRQWAEHELPALQMRGAALAAVLDELGQLPAEIRAAFEPELTEVWAELRRQTAIDGQQRLELGGLRLAGVQAAGEPSAAGRALQPGADAAAEAVRPELEGFEEDEEEEPERSGDGEEPQSWSTEAEVQARGATALPAPAPPSEPPEAARALRLPVLLQPERPVSWLAPAIRRLAERRSGRLAAELIAELLPLHGRLLESPIRYGVEIAELGELVVEVDEQGATARRLGPAEEEGPLAFRLAGPAAAFVKLAGGGLMRRPRGLKVRGSRRKAKQLFRACERPCALVDLVDASVSVWPGLLLAAIAEAIDPEWTAAASFLVAFVIRGAPGATIFLEVDGGAPIGLTASVEDGAEPQTSVYLSEHAFLCMVAGAPLPDGEQILLSGQAEPLELLSGWFAKAQGLTAPA